MTRLNQETGASSQLFVLDRSVNRKGQIHRWTAPKQNASVNLAGSKRSL